MWKAVLMFNVVLKAVLMLYCCVEDRVDALVLCGMHSCIEGSVVWKAE